MTNLYYGTVKQILERVSSVMIDREAIKDLVKYVTEVKFFIYIVRHFAKFIILNYHLLHLTFNF